MEFGEFLSQGLAELQIAVLQQPIETPQVESPQVVAPQVEAAPSFEMEMASYAAPPVQAMDMGMDR